MSTTVKSFKLSATDSAGKNHTLTFTDVNDTITSSTLANSYVAFHNVGYDIVSGQYITTTTDDKITPDD